MIVDIHAHVTCKGLPGLSRLLGRKPFVVSTLIKRMNREGIDKSVLLPLINPENIDYYAVAGNSECVEACRRHPDRLMTFCNVDPRTMFGRDVGRLLRAFKKLGCIGVGEICASLAADHRLFQNLYRAAADEAMPMLFHFTTKPGVTYGAVDDLGLPRLERMAEKFPQAVFIGHSPCFWNEIDGKLEGKDRNRYVKGRITKKGSLWRLFADYPNIYGDMSAGSGHVALSRDPARGFEFVNKFGHKIFFGTDRFTSGDEPVPPQLPFLQDALNKGKISRPVFDNITHKNFARVFNLKLYRVAI